jgi:hypothetical protein
MKTMLATIALLRKTIKKNATKIGIFPPYHLCHTWLGRDVAFVTTNTRA